MRYALVLLATLVQAQVPLYVACENSTNIIDVRRGSLVDNLGTSYAHNTLCEWNIQSSSNHVIKVTFPYFKTECGFDYLKIYDNELEMDIARLCGNIEIPPVIVSAGSRLSFEFSTDNAVDSIGFKMDFQLINGTHPCSEDSDCLNGGACLDNKCACDMSHRGLLCESRFAGFEPYTPREMHQATYDPITDSVYISFGLAWGSKLQRNSVVPLADLMHYDFGTQNWTLINAAGVAPSNRFGHFAWMHNSQLHIYGGITFGGVILHDMWSFNHSSSIWTQIFPTEILPGNAFLYNPTVVLVPSNNSIHYELYVFGNSGIYSEAFYVYSSLTNLWRQLPSGMLGLRGGAGAYHAETNSILIVAGFASEYDRYLANDIFYVQKYQIDSMEWTYESPRTLNEMVSHTSAHNIRDESIITLGGEKKDYWFVKPAQEDCFSSQMHILDTSCGKWTSRKIPNLQRKGHATIIRNDKAIVFGGNSGVLLNDFMEIDLALPVLTEDEKFKCKANTYCSSYGTSCKSCGLVPYCHWCNDACAYKTDRPQPDLGQSLPKKGLLNEGICPLSMNASIEVECPEGKINDNLVPFITIDQPTFGNVTYGSYNDYQISVSDSLNVRAGIYFDLLDQYDSNGRSVAEARLSLINLFPYSVTSRTRTYIDHYDINMRSYYIIRVSLSNSNGIKSRLPTSDDNVLSTSVKYQLIVYYRPPLSNNQNELFMALIAIAAGFICLTTGISFHLRRRRLRQYGSLLIIEPAPTLTPPSLFKVMIQINKIYNQTSMESLGESRPTLGNSVASCEMKRSVRLLIPEQENAPLPLAVEQISLKSLNKEPVLLTNESFIILWPGKERYLKRGDLPPMKIATNVRIQECDNPPKPKKKPA